MPGFASIDELIAEMTVGKRASRGFAKVGGAGLAGVWQSQWLSAGLPVAGANGAAGSGTPGAGGTAHTSAAGSIALPNVSTDLRYLISIMATANQPCTLMLYDRLVSVSALSVATATTVNVNSTALPRYASTTNTAEDYIANNEVWLEVTTATTVTAPVVTLSSYTNQAGTTGRAGTSLTFPAAATPVQSFLGPLPLQLGDQGVSSVQVLTVNTAATAGTVQLVILREIAWIPLIANIPNTMNYLTQMLSLPRLYDGHSIGLAILMPATTATTVWGEVGVGHG